MLDGRHGGRAALEGRDKQAARPYGRSPHASRLKPQACSLKPQASPRGFTLIEMLVTIAIIAILAGLALGTLFLAQGAAREENTRSLITKLNSQLMIRWDSYRTRRLPITFADAGNDPVEFARLQLWARRELMRMELPDQYYDLTFVPAHHLSNGNPVYPGMRGTFQRRINQVLTSQGMTPIDWSNQAAAEEDLYGPPENPAGIGVDNQSAELLYMIMTSGMETDGTGRKIFRESDVGDTDNDGMLEFIDGWGNPIEWIRWPAGFVSDVQPLMVETAAGTLYGTDDPLTPRPGPSAGTMVTRALSSNHDPFDPRGVDTWPSGHALVDAERAYRLMPLIVSAGPDGSTGDSEAYGLFFHPANGRPFDEHAAVADLNTDPYQVIEYTDNPMPPEPTPYRQRGMPVADEFGRTRHLDNIHNHMLQQ